MQKISSILKKRNLIATRYTKNKNVYFIDTNSSRYVVKKNSNNEYIYQYLKNRNFNYYPEIIDKDDFYTMSEYIDDVKIPKEQKILDMIDLVSLLHYKTTHYKEISSNDYIEIYEDIVNNIEYLNSYYMDMITYIETKKYMSPSQYHLALNISKIFSSINYCKEKIDLWYSKMKEVKKQRLVVLHNNLSLEHFLERDKEYLISWDKSKIGLPIFDLYKLYRRHYNDFDFSEIFLRYESKYPLTQEEKELLYILISLPDKFEVTNDSFQDIKKIVNIVNMINRTENLIFPEDSITREE